MRSSNCQNRLAKRNQLIVAKEVALDHDLIV